VICCTWFFAKITYMVIFDW